MTKYSVKVNDPALPDGHEVEVPGLGMFKNNNAQQITEEDAENFRTASSKLVDVETDDRPAWTGAAGIELRRGPTVLQAFEGHPIVSVEAVVQSKTQAPKAGDSKDKVDTTKES